jgi:hypothetical protein
MGTVIKLEDLVKCPLDWEKKFGPDAWWLSLPQLDWYYSFAQHAVDYSELPLDLPQVDIDYEDPEELRRLLANISDRRPAAEKLYMTRAGRLYDLTFMTPAEHGKHFAARMTEKDALERSRETGISFFFKNYSSADLERAFWAWFWLTFQNVQSYGEYEEFLDPEAELSKSPEAALWHRLLSETGLRICTDTLLPVGACNGEPTSFLCYDMHFGSKTAHCIPVSEAEAKRIMGDLEILGNDALNC